MESNYWFQDQMMVATWAYRALVLAGIGLLGLDIHGFGNDPWFVSALLYGMFLFMSIYISARLVLRSLDAKEVDLDVE